VIRALAFPKLTLSLRVLGRRADGYHDIEALTVSLSGPADILEIEPAPETSLVVEGPFRAGVPADMTNLAWRAAEALGTPLAIRLTKEIPHGAGLGGGSADAAAVLVAGGGDEHLGATLGSDVPFCLRGGAAWMRGRGELLEPVTLPPLRFVLAVPDFACSTPAVYRAWDELGGPSGRVVEVDGVGPLANDLEPAAERVEPRLREFREHLERVSGRPALLAGSGSAYVIPIPAGGWPTVQVDRTYETTTQDFGVSIVAAQ
jgi:4-diphosphocytidyl-2-C-methyl-D-erythritol kinase